MDNKDTSVPCNNCMMKFLNDKRFKRDRLCPSCGSKKFCTSCDLSINQDDAMKICLLRRKFIRKRVEIEDHNQIVAVVLLDIMMCIDDLENLISKLKDGGIIIDIGKKITDLEVKFKEFSEFTCMKRLQSIEESAAGRPNTDSVHQNAVYQKTTLWNASCSSCNKIFDKNDLINNLICGHSVCSICPSNNHLDPCEDRQRDTARLKQNIVTFLQNMKEKFARKESLFNEHIGKMKNVFKLIEDGIKCLTIEWKEIRSGNTINIIHVREEIARWEHELEEIEKKICKAEERKLNNEILFEHEWGNNYLWKSQYLHEVCYLVKKKEKKVYVMFMVENNCIYGELSSDGNHIFFHTMELDTKEEQAFFLNLHDLKICVGELFYPFITVKCRNNVNLRYTLKLYDHQASSQFIKLCTGENSVSYKGLSFTEGDITDPNFKCVLHISMDQKKEKESFLELTSHTEYSYKIGDHFLLCSKNGSIYVCRALTGGIKVRSFGVVISREYISEIDFSTNKVVDCGIQIFHF